MSETTQFHNVGQLRALLQDLPDNHPILGQVVAADGSVWSMFMSFTPSLRPGGDMAALTFSHLQLSSLNPPSFKD